MKCGTSRTWQLCAKATAVSCSTVKQRNNRNRNPPEAGSFEQANLCNDELMIYREKLA